VKSQSHSSVSSVLREKETNVVLNDRPETLEEVEEGGGERRKDSGLLGLRRSTTQPLDKVDEDNSGLSIKER